MAYSNFPRWACEYTDNHLKKSSNTVLCPNRILKFYSDLRIVRDHSWLFIENIYVSIKKIQHGIKDKFNLND